jgi:hypothetical protein
MSDNSTNKTFFESVFDALNKLDKVLVLLLSLVGYLTFKEGSRIVSYIFVMGAYFIFSFTLAKVLRAKQEKASVIFTPSQNRKTEYVYSKMQRWFAGIGFVVITIFISFWMINNLSQDLSLKSGQSASPSITITSPTQAPTANVELEKDDSLPRFALENLNSYSCLYGQDQKTSDLIWLVIGEKQNVRVGGSTYPIDEKAAFELASLLLVPEQVVLSEVNVQINYLREPPDEKEIQYVTLAGCGRGGSPVFPVVFSEIELLPDSNLIKLNAESLSLPYQLSNGDTLDFHLPIIALTPGEYEMYYTAKVVLFSGEVVAIDGKPLRIGIINPSQIISKDIEVK